MVFFYRKIVRNEKELLREIQRYETPMGSIEFDGVDISNQALAIYITENPKSLLKAHTKTHRDVLDHMVHSYENGASDEDLKYFQTIQGKFLSNLHKSTSAKMYMDIDIDSKESEYLESIIKLLGEMDVVPTCCIETRGGYHVIVRSDTLSKEQKGCIWKVSQKKELKFQAENSLGKKITKSYIEIFSDGMCPIPGTYQGGFPVKFIDIDSFKIIFDY